MVSTEQTVKDQFAKVFASSDWRLFKEIADINLAEAAVLKKASFNNVPAKLRLLVRNSRKRLLIGIGVELVIKSVYLKAGYAINKPKDSKAGPKMPFLLADTPLDQLNSNETYVLSRLIDHLDKVLPVKASDDLMQGLRIAKVFRNKEGHIVTGAHAFKSESFRKIEQALRELYFCAFKQQLAVQFSMAPKEKGRWSVAL